MTKLAVRLAHHDHEYVEDRGGWALLTHLRGAASRARYRTEAIDRAFDRFVEAEDGGRANPKIGGLALLVLQRALLAAEDLGGLLYAFRGSDPWARLVSARVPDLDAAFEAAFRDPELALAAISADPR